MFQIRVLMTICCLTVLGFAYTNCSQAGNIAVKEAQEKTLTTGEVGPTSPTTVTEILQNCEKAQSSGTLMTLSQNINFEDSRVETNKSQICEFAPPGKQTVNGNLEMAAEKMQTRYEQVRSLNLPANAVICDIEMKNNLQKFKYDDVFFFTFNGSLLASNNKTSVQQTLMPKSAKLAANQFTDIYTYDWTKLRTFGFVNEADDYCLGSAEGLSTCKWPVSEQSGEIKFSFAQSLLISLSAGIKSDQQKFAFIITGDDDPTLDCYHEKLEFAMNVKYFIPQ